MRLHLLWGTNCSIPRYGRRRRQIQSRTISSCLSGGWLLLPSQWGICYNNIPRLTTNKDSSENHVTFPSGENIKFAKVTIWTLKKKYIYTNILLFGPQFHFTQQVLSVKELLPPELQLFSLFLLPSWALLLSCQMARHFARFPYISPFFLRTYLLCD